MIRVFIKGQELRVSSPLIASDTIDYLEAAFHFQTSEWDGLEKWAHFSLGDLNYLIKLTDDQIHKSDHLNLSAGIWQVWLHGNEISDGTVTERITTNIASFTVEKSGVLNGEPLPISPPSFGETVYAEVQELERRVTKIEKEGGGGGTTTLEEVDPAKVIFSDGLLTTYELGKVKLENGIGTLVEPGGNLLDFFDVFMDEKVPETVEPSVSLTFSQAKAYEVGTTVTPSYSASLKPGSYTYGPETGVVASEWAITDTDGNSADTASGSFPELTVADGISYRITAKATYGTGAMPVTNTGNDYPDGQIEAGTKSATSGAITGYRNTFYGTLTAKSDITSDIVRGLTGKSGKTLANGNAFTVTIPVGALRVVFAYPATLRDVTSVKDVNGMNAEISSSFTKQTVNVEGANGYTAISYKVYTLDFANANDTANKFTVQI